MELIKKLGVRINKNGKRIRYGIFWCDFCKQEVEKRLDWGKLAKSCGCVQYKLSAESNRGKKHSEEYKQRMKKINEGKKLTEETKEKIRNKAKGRVQTDEAKQKISKFQKGKVTSEETKQKMREARINFLNSDFGKNQKLENNPNWNNGSSFEPYGIEFNKELKQSIKDRDFNTCQNPNCKEEHKRLAIHHIDFNKNNNNPENLITLGISCHIKTNSKKNRKYWISYYQNIMETKINV